MAPLDSVVLPGQQMNNNPWTSAFRQDHISSVHQFQGMFDVLRESRKFQVACLQFTSVIVNTHCVPYHSFFLFGGGGGDSYLKYQQVPTVKFIFVMKHSISFQLFISRIRLIHIFFKRPPREHVILTGCNFHSSVFRIDVKELKAFYALHYLFPKGEIKQ